MKIERMSMCHLEQIEELEKMCFSDPWCIAMLAPELANPLSLWLVALDGEQVVGYVGSQSVLDSADMMNIAVHPDFRRQGIAQRLIRSLAEELINRNVRTLLLEVRASNTAAIRLYERLQFCQIGCRPGYYKRPKEDALIMRKELS